MSIARGLFKGILYALFAFLLLVLIGFAFFKWRQQSKYKEIVTIKAIYMQYACGDCSLDMEVISVDNATFNFIVGKEIHPTAKERAGLLCDFIGSSMSEKNNERINRNSYILKGRLHKYPHAWSMFSCNESPFFTVESIVHAASGASRKF